MTTLRLKGAATFDSAISLGQLEEAHDYLNGLGRATVNLTARRIEFTLDVSDDLAQPDEWILDIAADETGSSPSQLHHALSIYLTIQVVCQDMRRVLGRIGEFGVETLLLDDRRVVTVPAPDPGEI